MGKQKDPAYFRFLDFRQVSRRHCLSKLKIDTKYHFEILSTISDGLFVKNAEKNQIQKLIISIETSFLRWRVSKLFLWLAAMMENDWIFKSPTRPFLDLKVTTNNDDQEFTTCCAKAISVPQLFLLLLLGSARWFVTWILHVVLRGLAHLYSKNKTIHRFVNCATHHYSTTATRCSDISNNLPL